MHKLLLSLLFSVFMISCKKEETLDQNKVIHHKIDGIYLLNSAFTSNAVDLNQDGVALNDMIREIPNIKNSNIEIKVTSTFMYFYMLWPEQDTRQFPSNYWYEKAVYAKMNFDEHNNQLLIEKKTDDAVTGWYPPQEAYFQNDKIRMKMKRTLLTKTGMKEVIIDATYVKMPEYKSEYR
ncbi:hypothetical protein [Pedobacter sp.]|uniref:hypothetical protein n=1 Tax=Pedobacter sp. TaxID=1411316 RepID=UPI003D7FC025